jgi:hypothetical protein
VSTHLLIESALRSLIMGAAIFAALRLLRIHQVRARRAAWLLALAGALAMPVLVAAQIGPPLLPDIAVFRAPQTARLPKAESAAQEATRRAQPITSASPAGAAATEGGPSRGARLMSAPSSST